MGAPLTHIMIIEDEMDIQTIARLSLEVLGNFTVMTCSSGAEALAQAPQFAPQLILLDVMMPNMDGPATLQALRALPATGHIPIIFMTAKMQSHEVAQYQVLGALDVIGKPFDPMQLPAMIRTIWERHFP